MQTIDKQQLKSEVHDFWNRQSCDTQVAKSAKFTREYFEEVERFRYFDQPFIHSFAQFTRYHGRRVLEVGFGAGTDYIQWLRAGAQVSGIDLTEEALAHVQHRTQVYHLPPSERLEVGDAENLPFPSDAFDLGYSFGVLMCTPDTPKAVAELVRVVKPGGEVKLMLYNRNSIYAMNRWVKYALLRGRPWKSRSWVLWHYMESAGTKGYTRGELRAMLQPLPLGEIQVDTVITAADHLSAAAFPPLNWIYRLAITLAGYHYGWLPSHYVLREGAPDRRSNFTPPRRGPKDILFTGNPLGFFHCISARKTA